MRKCALFIAVVMVASAPTMALAAKKKAAAAPKKYDTNAANMNDSSQRLVRNMWMLPVTAWNASVKK